MPVAENAVARVDLANLAHSSAVRLHDPTSHGNSFSLDGFPAVAPGADWLARLIEVIEQQGAIGMTTNQTLFRQLTESGSLDDRFRALKAEGRSSKEIYWTLYNEAATQAARAFGEIHAQWPWEGRVSQEASAFLTDLDPLVADVQRIAKAMGKVGAFTKVPNVHVGPQALRKAIAYIGDSPHSGTVPFQVHPNVTLVFSDRHYLDTVEGFLMGLGDRVRALRSSGAMTDEIRNDLGQIHSVNSLFVSRTDRVVDPMIEETLRRAQALRQAQGERNLALLKGKVAVAQAKKIYQIFEAVFLEKPFQDPLGLYADMEGQAMVRRIGLLRDLFQELKKFGANPQRLLIASSGVKSDQPYHPLLYVLPFLGPWTANTLPEGTLKALSQFVGGLSDDEAGRLRSRNLMGEPLPAIPSDCPSPFSSPQGGEGRVRGEWERTLLMTSEERKEAEVGELTADWILKEASEKVLKPAGTSLRTIGDTLRDKGAASFTADEQATLQAIESKLQSL